MAKKEYIGDGVYINYDEEMKYIVLTAENGVAVQETIYLELEHIDMIADYAKRVREGD